MKNKVFDFLGNPIKEGMRGVRVHSYSNSKEFKKITVKCVDLGRKHKDVVGIVTDGNGKIGWTYPERVIIETSITVKI